MKEQYHINTFAILPGGDHLYSGWWQRETAPSSRDIQRILDATEFRGVAEITLYPASKAQPYVWPFTVAFKGCPNHGCLSCEQLQRHKPQLA